MQIYKIECREGDSMFDTLQTVWSNQSFFNYESERKLLNAVLKDPNERIEYSVEALIERLGVDQSTSTEKSISRGRITSVWNGVKVFFEKVKFSFSLFSSETRSSYLKACSTIKHSKSQAVRKAHQQMLQGELGDKIR